MKRQMRGIGIYLVFLAIVIAAIYMSSMITSSSQTYNQEKFLKSLEQGTITYVRIYPGSAGTSGRVVATFENDNETEFYVSSVSAIEEKLDEVGFERYTVHKAEGAGIFVTILPYLFGLIVIFLLFTFLSGQNAAGGGNSRMMNFGKSRAVMTTKEQNSVTFQEVAGLQEEKEELEEIVDFLRNPKKYLHVGARIPKGILLEGPPGTGKTLLAKAVAGEAGVPFFSISGSDFVEMFVGVGASRVRDLFEEATRNAPCIIFIDEIDAVARRRGTGLGGGHDEQIGRAHV